MQKRCRRAAGLLPAAVEEIKRLRAEWAALKHSDLLDTSSQSNRKKSHYKETLTKRRQAPAKVSSEVLRGVVALVEVGTEHRALPLRAALTALGATVLPIWSPLVTHLIWGEGGDRESRVEARASAACVVSPLWVEACAASNCRLPENTFPAAPRPSDVPSPNTLLRLLEKAEKSNVPVSDLLSKKMEGEPPKMKPVATVTSRDVEPDDSGEESHQTDRRADVWRDKFCGPSRDLPTDGSKITEACDATAGPSNPGTSSGRPETRRSPDTTTDPAGPKRRRASSSSEYSSSSPDEDARVNKKPRRALPKSVSTSEVATVRPYHIDTPSKKPVCELAQEPRPKCQKKGKAKAKRKGQPPPAGDRLTQREADAVARAERSARKQAARHGHLTNRDPASAASQEIRSRSPRAGRSGRPPPALTQETVHSRDGKIRIVLTGMSREERQAAFVATTQLRSAKIQKNVNYKTTHIVVGHFGKGPYDLAVVESGDDGPVSSRQLPSPLRSSPPAPRPAPAHPAHPPIRAGDDTALRTLSTLSGAARGCRVVYSEWLFDSRQHNCWLSFRPYSVPDLKNISEKAFVERHAYDMMHTEYAYNVFYGRRVRLSTSAENRHAAEHLLALCGAVVIDKNGQILHNADLDQVNMPPEHAAPPRPPRQHGGPRNRRLCRPHPERHYPVRSKNGERLVWRAHGPLNQSEVVIGARPGQVSSKWVFDCVSHARMRSARQYTASGAG